MDNRPSVATIYVHGSTDNIAGGHATPAKVAFHSLTAGTYGSYNADENVFTVDIVTNDRITVKKPGLYRVRFSGALTATANQNVILSIRRNATADTVLGAWGYAACVANALTSPCVIEGYVLADIGNYFELWQDDDDGANFQINYGTFSVEWIG